jgi:mannose-6-phosphate isomerase-like protein (cupin superfamily)
MNLPQSDTQAGFAGAGFLGPFRFLSPGQAWFFARHLTTRKERPTEGYKSLALADPLIATIAADPSLLRLLATLLGDDIVLWGASVVMRQPGQEHAWHCDIESADRAGGFASLWVGLGNAGGNGGLKLLPGSHHFGASVQESAAGAGIARDERSDDSVLALARARDPDASILRPEVADGEAILFDGRLWHGSETTERPRISLLLQYARADRRLRVPDLRTLEWPFAYREDVRLPVIPVAGRAHPETNVLASQARFSGLPEIAPSHTEIDCDTPLPDGVRFQPTPCFEGRTPNCDYLECHYSTLAPGHSPHAPHIHPEEEILVVMSGEARLVLPMPDDPDKSHMVIAPAGTGIYYPAFRRHTITNVGAAPVRYAMLKWKSMAITQGKQLPPRLLRADWGKATAQPSALPLLDGPTAYHERLHAHATCVPSGSGYAAHEDDHDVAIFLLEGEINIMGRRIVAPGLAFYPAGTLHDMKATGSTSARYLVWEFHRGAGQHESRERTRDSKRAAACHAGTQLQR